MDSVSKLQERIQGIVVVAPIQIRLEIITFDVNDFFKWRDDLLSTPKVKLYKQGPGIIHPCGTWLHVGYETRIERIESFDVPLLILFNVNKRVIVNQ